MSGLPPGNVSEEQDLGNAVTESFKSSKQCNISTAKANRSLRIIKKTFSPQDGVMLTKLYQSLVRSHLEYCIQAWSPHLQHDIDTLEKIQRRATKMVSGFEHSPRKRRHKHLNIAALRTRRNHGD